MVHLIIGILTTALFWWIMDYSKKKDIKLSKWKKIITALWAIYAAFVAEVIVGFLHEREPKAALVMGMTTGIFAIIWSVLLWRFVYNKQAKAIEFKLSKQN